MLHTQLKVWQRAIDLAVETHRLVQSFRPENRIAYGDQFRRASISVAANIAEGAARRHSKEFMQFLAIARGSVAELHTLLVLAERLAMSDADRFPPIADVADHVGRMLTSTMRAVARRTSSKRYRKGDRE